MKTIMMATSLRLTAICALVFCCWFEGSAATAPADIVTDGSGITLGSGWYSREVFQGRPFHWANNNSAILIHNPQSNVKKIALDIQGGPGLANAQKFTLHVRSNNEDIATIVIPGTKVQRLDVPVQPGHTTTITLHVDNGGKKIPKDPRILNFRVFSISDVASDKTLGAGHPDINGPRIILGNNWYDLEEYGGETFRWVKDDAFVSVSDSQGGNHVLQIVAASGPAVAHPSNWTLMLQDQSGKTVASAQIKGRGKASFDLSKNHGDVTYKLHVTSTDAKTANDPRTLSFRVFKIAVI